MPALVDNAPTHDRTHASPASGLRGVADDNKKYLSTDLLRDEPVRDDFLSPHVKLHHIAGIKRVCKICCDPTSCYPDADPEDAMLSCPGILAGAGPACIKHSV